MLKYNYYKMGRFRFINITLEHSNTIVPSIIITVNRLRLLQLRYLITIVDIKIIAYCMGKY